MLKLIREWLNRDTDWRESFARKPVTLADGTSETGLLMRRRVSGVWQYRRPTPDEEREAVWQQAR